MVRGAGGGSEVDGRYGVHPRAGVLDNAARQSGAGSRGEAAKVGLSYRGRTRLNSGPEGLHPLHQGLLVGGGRRADAGAVHTPPLLGGSEGDGGGGRDGEVGDGGGGVCDHSAKEFRAREGGRRRSKEAE